MNGYRRIGRTQLGTRVGPWVGALGCLVLPLTFVGCSVPATCPERVMAGTGIGAAGGAALGAIIGSAPGGLTAGYGAGYGAAGGALVGAGVGRLSCDIPLGMAPGGGYGGGSAPRYSSSSGMPAGGRSPALFNPWAPAPPPTVQPMAPPPQSWNNSPGPGPALAPLPPAAVGGGSGPSTSWSNDAAATARAASADGGYGPIESVGPATPSERSY